MTVEKLLEKKNLTDRYRSLGNIPNKRLAKILKRYKYIEVDESFYDDPDRPDFNTWFEIEGMDYGWCWMSYQGDELRKELRKMALCNRRDEEVYVFVNEKYRIYIYSLGDSVIQIILSNKELKPFFVTEDV